VVLNSFIFHNTKVLLFTECAKNFLLFGASLFILCVAFSI